MASGVTVTALSVMVETQWQRTRYSLHAGYNNSAANCERCGGQGSVDYVVIKMHISAHSERAPIVANAGRQEAVVRVMIRKCDAKIGKQLGLR